MAKDLNLVILVGRLTNDFNLSYTKTGLAVGKFSIANNTLKKEETNFFEIVILGKLAETLQPYLEKGKQVAVSGDLKQSRWTDATTGTSRSKVSVVATTIQLLSSGNQNQNSSGPNQKSTFNQNSSNVEETGIFEDDIPF